MSYPTKSALVLAVVVAAPGAPGHRPFLHPIAASGGAGIRRPNFTLTA